MDINLDIVTSTRNIPAGLTHLFTENCYQSQLSTIARHSVHCVSADYIGDFVIKVSLEKYVYCVSRQIEDVKYIPFAVLYLLLWVTETSRW